MSAKTVSSQLAILKLITLLGLVSILIYLLSSHAQPPKTLHVKSSASSPSSSTLDCSKYSSDQLANASKVSQPNSCLFTGCSGFFQ